MCESGGGQGPHFLLPEKIIKAYTKKFVSINESKLIYRLFASKMVHFIECTSSTYVHNYVKYIYFLYYDSGHWVSYEKSNQ